MLSVLYAYWIALPTVQIVTFLKGLWSCYKMITMTVSTHPTHPDSFHLSGDLDYERTYLAFIETCNKKRALSPAHESFLIFCIKKSGTFWGQIGSLSRNLSIQNITFKHLSGCFNCNHGVKKELLVKMTLSENTFSPEIGLKIFFLDIIKTTVC